MIRFAVACLAGTLLSAPAIAASPFDGTWKGELQSAQIDIKPQVWSIKGGLFDCRTCLPPYAVKADGNFHAVPGHDYWDEVRVAVVDPHTVKYTYRKAGKDVTMSTATVSADGNTLTYRTRDTNNGGGVPVDTTAAATRIGAPTTGAHLVSGSWRPRPASAISAAAMTMAVKVDGDMFHLKTGTGETLDAKIGGDWAPNVGDPGKTMTRVERVGPESLKLTDRRGGKIVNVTTYTVSGGGKVMTGTWTDPRDGSKGTFKAVKS